MTGLLVDPARRIDSRSVSTRGAALAGPSPNLLSSPAQVRRALTVGRVRRTGTATIAGRRAIARSVRVSRDLGGPSLQMMLLVDARDDQPLRATYVFRNRLDPEIADWVPATPAHIARAIDDAIPAGYRRVATVG